MEEEFVEGCRTQQATQRGKGGLKYKQPNRELYHLQKRKDERRHKMRKGNWRRGMDRHSIIHGDGARLSERSALLYMALRRRRRPPATAVSLFSTFPNVYGEQRAVRNIVQRSSESTNDDVMRRPCVQSVTVSDRRARTDHERRPGQSRPPAVSRPL